VIAGPSGIALESVEPPPARSGQLAIRAACSLISAGTELHYRDQALRTGAPQPLGYCSTGVVIEVGPGAIGFAPGDRVAAMGWGYALHAEQVAVPFRLCVRLPDGLAFEHAVFADLAATALHAIHRATLHPDDRVLVVGAGLVGLLVAQCARGRSAQVIVADRVPERAAVARRLGVEGLVAGPGTLVEQVRAATGGRGPDAVLLCMQGEATELVRDCVQLLSLAPPGARHRRVVAVGRFSATVDFSVAMGNIDLRYAARCGAGYRDDEFVHGRADVPVPAGEQTVTENLAECVRALAAGTLRAEPLISHRIALDHAPEAYRLLERPEGALGVLLTYPALASPAPEPR
jgi:threonine dehydrogenase-like Zn-dependent dehydrogenase